MNTLSLDVLMILQNEKLYWHNFICSKKYLKCLGKKKKKKLEHVFIWNYELKTVILTVISHTSWPNLVMH